MITGVTHITMEGALKRGIELGAALGFTVDFIDEVALPAGFEGVVDDDHELPLALLAGPEGIRWEIVEHRQPTGRRGSYAALFRCAPPTGARPAPPAPAVADLLRRGNVLREPAFVTLDASAGEAWFDASPAAGGLAGILSRAVDVAAETDFWSRFARFRWTTVDATGACGHAPSLVMQPGCEFVVVADDGPAVSHNMNDNGFPSMGVFSTSIERDCGKALAAGARLRAEPILTTVGGRSASMALVETPNGCMVELLSVRRPATGAYAND